MKDLDAKFHEMLATREQEIVTLRTAHAASETARVAAEEALAHERHAHLLEKKAHERSWETGKRAEVDRDELHSRWKGASEMAVALAAERDRAVAEVKLLRQFVSFHIFTGDVVKMWNEIVERRGEEKSAAHGPKCGFPAFACDCGVFPYPQTEPVQDGSLYVPAPPPSARAEEPAKSVGWVALYSDGTRKFFVREEEARSYVTDQRVVHPMYIAPSPAAKAEEPVAWLLTDRYGACHSTVIDPSTEPEASAKYTVTPLFHTPPDLTAEIAKLRERERALSVDGSEYQQEAEALREEVAKLKAYMSNQYEELLQQHKAEMAKSLEERQAAAAFYHAEIESLRAQLDGTRREKTVEWWESDHSVQRFGSKEEADEASPGPGGRIITHVTRYRVKPKPAGQR